MRQLRTTIGGLMAVVLVAAVGLAALLNPNPIWAGAIFLASWGCIGMAIVGAFLRRGAGRAWWLGFAVFGGGYLLMAAALPAGPVPFSGLPTSVFLTWLRQALGHPVASGVMMNQKLSAEIQHFTQIGHMLLAIIAGLIGGIIAPLIAPPIDLPERSVSDAPTTADQPRRRWLRPALIVWVVLLLACSLLAIRSGPEARAWASAAFFLTCGLLGLLVLMALFGRGRRRQAAVGAVLFGVVYLYLAFGRGPYYFWPPGRVLAMRSLYQPMPTSAMLNSLRRWTAAIAGGDAAANARIVSALEQPVDMTFPDPTPLKDVLRYITAATATPDYPGIPIYLDPSGLKRAGEASDTFGSIRDEPTPDSPVTIDLVGVPLKTSLRLCLEPLGLDYCAREGYVWVTDRADVDADNYGVAIVYYNPQREDNESIEPATDLDDPFLVAGHCLLALLAAGFGAMAAPIAADASRGPDARNPGPTGHAPAA